jgi:hypothetical protein
MPTRAAREQNAGYIQALKNKAQDVKWFQRNRKLPLKFEKCPLQPLERKKEIKKNVFFEKMKMFLFAIKFCISYNISSNEYTKFRITYYANGLFKKSFRFVDFLSSTKLSNLLFCSKFRMNLHRYHFFLRKFFLKDIKYWSFPCYQI